MSDRSPSPRSLAVATLRLAVVTRYSESDGASLALQWWVEAGSAVVLVKAHSW